MRRNGLLLGRLHYRFQRLGLRADSYNCNPVAILQSHFYYLSLLNGSHLHNLFVPEPGSWPRGLAASGRPILEEEEGWQVSAEEERLGSAPRRPVSTGFETVDIPSRWG